MTVKVEIVSNAFKSMKGTSKQGKPYDMAMQDGYLHAGAAYPERFELPLEKGPSGDWVPYQPGFYTLTAGSYQIRDGRLGVNSFEMKLLPLPAESKPRAAGA